MAATNSKQLEWLCFLYNNCCVCKSHTGLTLHHVVPKCKDLLTNPERFTKSLTTNQALMCEKCHLKYHQQYDIDNCNKETFVDFVNKERKFEVFYVKKTVKSGGANG